MTSITRLDPPKWSRVEAGYYVRPIGLTRTLEIVHKDATPADKLHLNRWVVRLVERKKPTTELGRFASKREAQDFANEQR